MPENLCHGAWKLTMSEIFTDSTSCFHIPCLCLWLTLVNRCACLVKQGDDFLGGQYLRATRTLFSPCPSKANFDQRLRSSMHTPVTLLLVL